MAEIVLTMADLETAVPLNAALEAAGFTTAPVAAVDDARAASGASSRTSSFSPARCTSVDRDRPHHLRPGTRGLYPRPARAH
ncbi:MAG: hypothetical protein R2882_06855 [Gemmatimonadales bacterium]